jgi:hypothetical protein
MFLLFVNFTAPAGDVYITDYLNKIKTKLLPVYTRSIQVPVGFNRAAKGLLPSNRQSDLIASIQGVVLLQFNSVLCFNLLTQQLKEPGGRAV